MSTFNHQRAWINSSFSALFIITLLGFGALFASLPAKAATLSCNEEHQINTRFDNGSGWDMCWTSTRQENIVLSEIHYQPSNQQPIHVISSIRLAQLHVTYDDSVVTYNDVTQFGLGGGHVSTLLESDCTDGQLLNISDRAGLCKQVSTGDTAFHTDDETALDEVLTLFSVSQVGSYAYIVTWKFHDDGTIEPSVGAAGALQRSAASDSEQAEHNEGDTHHPTDHGRELEGAPGKIWLSHTHNYYWRIDFDIGEDAENDVVTEVSYPLDDAGRRPKQLQKLLNESARKINPDTLTAWYITDDEADILEAPGYLIEPIRYGHKLVRQEQEPYTEFDFFVTRQNDCERYLSENTKFNPDCADDISQYTNNEPLQGQDLVVWHRISFHHVPRNEDKHHMHSHWDGFVMQARNLSSSTPRHSGVTKNIAPSIETVNDQLNQVGDAIHLELVTSDLDSDTLDYQHSGLPTGLSISDQGVIEGVVSQTGRYNTTVQTSDGHLTTTTRFNWDVKSTAKTGAGNYTLLFILAGFALGRKRKLHN